jgi:hypothetical protein
MPSLFKSAHLVFIASLLVGLSGSTRADASEPLAPATDPVVEAASSGPIRCVTLADGVLDLRVTADVSDVWSLDANASVGGSDGNVTLYVVSASPIDTLTVKVLFLKLSDSAKITNSNGVETTLTPISTRDPVQRTVALAEEQSFTLLATATTSTPAVTAPGPIGATNKAVIKRVKTCPT